MNKYLPIERVCKEKKKSCCHFQTLVTWHYCKRCIKITNWQPPKCYKSTSSTTHTQLLLLPQDNMCHQYSYSEMPISQCADRYLYAELGTLIGIHSPVELSNVWSTCGPVLLEGVLPAPTDQSNVSRLSWMKPERPFSKLLLMPHAAKQIDTQATGRHAEHRVTVFELLELMLSKLAKD